MMQYLKRVINLLGKSTIKDRENQFFINHVYRSILGRNADGLGAQYYLSRLNQGASYVEIIKEIESSAEARDKNRVGVSPEQVNYELWIKLFDRLTLDDYQMILSDIHGGDLIELSLLVFIQKSDLPHIKNLVAGLSAQLYQPIAVILILDETLDSSDYAYLEKSFENLNCFYMTERSQKILSLVKTPGIIFLYGAVYLKEYAFYLFSKALTDQKIKMVYADEDQINTEGIRSCPFFKPGYSKTLSESMNYFGSCIAVATDFLMNFAALLLDEVRIQSMDSFFELIRDELSIQSVTHIDNVLYSQFQEPSYARVEKSFSERISFEDKPKVSIIIPTRDRHDLLAPCIESIYKHTRYPKDRLEILVIDNGSKDKAALSYLRQGVLENQFILLKDDGDFNYARLNNDASQRASGDVLVFLNNDTLITQDDWLVQIVNHVMQPETGVVGVKLLYSDETVQHGGVLVEGKVSAHLYVGINKDAPGYHQFALVNRDVSAVTGACMAVRQDVFFELGGFDEHLAVAFNDTLLCMEALRYGYNNVQLNTVCVTHFESKSRGYDDSPEKAALALRERLYFMQKIKKHHANDRYYNSNLSLDHFYTLALPPRKQPACKHKNAQATKKRILILLKLKYTDTKEASIILLHIKTLLNQGYEIHIGGGIGELDHIYSIGINRFLNDVKSAAIYAYQHYFDCVWVFTTPFFGIVSMVRNWARTVVFGDHYLQYDFEDKNILLDFSLSHVVYVSSEENKSLLNLEHTEVLPDLVLIQEKNVDMNLNDGGFGLMRDERNSWDRMISAI